jgi:aryl-alcohol dehydrogenase-like predicted oxidoreductase
MNQSATARTTLGTTDIEISALGLGIWSWGESLIWDYGKDFDREDVNEAWQASIEGGITFIDTAEAYGFGRSERILGELLQEGQDRYQVATKFLPFPWRLFPSQLERALMGSLRRLQRQKVELYQIHHPLPLRAPAIWLRAMAEQHQLGRLDAIGISNFNLERTKEAAKTLADFDLPLAANQLEFSLLDRTIEHKGLLQYCHDHGITVIAYSPLAQGLLTGKYSEQNPPPGPRSRRSNEKTWRRLNPLLAAMKRMAQAHGDRSPAQVALNWARAKGTVPIPGAKTKVQALDNAAALEWELEMDEVAELDELSYFTAER